MIRRTNGNQQPPSNDKITQCKIKQLHINYILLYRLCCCTYWWQKSEKYSAFILFLSCLGRFLSCSWCKQRCYLCIFLFPWILVLLTETWRVKELSSALHIVMKQLQLLWLMFWFTCYACCEAEPAFASSTVVTCFLIAYWTSLSSCIVDNLN